MYLVNDTIEEAIYEISVDRRLAHMKRKQDGTESHAKAPDELEERSFEAANTLEMQANPTAELLAKDRSAGEVVSKDDLGQCLFTKRMRVVERISAYPNGIVDSAVRAEAVEQRRADLGSMD